MNDKEEKASISFVAGAVVSLAIITCGIGALLTLRKGRGR